MRSAGACAAACVGAATSDEVGDAAASALAVGPPHEEVADAAKRWLRSAGCDVCQRDFVAWRVRLRRRRALWRCIAASAGGVAYRWRHWECRGRVGAAVVGGAVGALVRRVRVPLIVFYSLV